MKNLETLVEQSFNYAVEVVQLYNVLSEEGGDIFLSEQMMLSATSQGANIRMAMHEDEHSSDFAHLVKEAKKDIDESLYWMELLKHSGVLQDEVHKTMCQKGKDLFKNVQQIVLKNEQSELI